MKLVRTENCIPVKGANRSLICDLQRGVLKLIPNDLYDILDKHNGKSVEDIKAFYDYNFDKIIDEYIDFLIENDFAFFTDHPEWFPKMNKDFNYPTNVSNAIIDFNQNSKFDFEEVLIELTGLGVESLQIRIFEKIGTKKLQNILSQTQVSGLIKI